MKISHLIKNQKVKIVLLNNPSCDDIKMQKLKNIGLYEGEEIFILDKTNNNKIIHLLVRGVEYAFRIEDLDFIDVEVIENGESKQIS